MKNLNDLVKKYWKGISEVEEENTLKEYFGKKENNSIEDEYFRYLEYKRKEKVKAPDFDRELLRQLENHRGISRVFQRKIYWQIAATVVILVAASVFFIPRQKGSPDQEMSSKPAVTEDTYKDPLLAYEETKKALLIISSNLNKSKTYATELVKFSQSQENLKKNN
jgi:hypothetical protein